jgi:hypothetical protein
MAGRLGVVVEVDVGVGDVKYRSRESCQESKRVAAH